MSARSKSSLENFIRGSVITQYRFSMLTRSLAQVCLLAMAVGLLTLWMWLFVFYSSTERAIFFYYRIAALECAVSLGWMPLLSRTIHLPGVDATTLLPFGVKAATQQAYDSIFGLWLYVGYIIALAATIGSGRFIFDRFRGYGRAKGEAEFLRGTKLVDLPTLTKLVGESRVGSGPYKLAGVPIPDGYQMRNIGVLGAMGVGKSEFIFDLADQVFARGKKSIVWDKTGEFTRLYFRPGKDVILNPFDTRYPGWNIFSEVRMHYEFDQIAHSFCPDPDDKDSKGIYFASGARTVLTATMRKLWQQNRRTTAELAKVLLLSSPLEMAEFLRGTEASAYIAPGAEEQAGGVLSTLTGAIQFLKYVPDGSFCIRDWVLRDDDSRLFIASNESVNDILRPIVAAYLDIAVRATMSREETREDRLWVWLDELSSLGNIPILKTSLTEGRRYGVVHMIGMHNVAQLETIYGDKVARTLRSNLQNFMVCRAAEEETLESLSKLLGTKEMDEQQEGLSYGPAQSKDGGSVQTSRREMRIVLPSEIKMLPDCAGFLQLAGAYPIARVEWAHKARQHYESAYLVRDDLHLPAEDAKNEVEPVADKKIEVVGL